MNFTKDTMFAILMGFTMILLSILMIPLSGSTFMGKVASFTLRDLLMIFLLGVVFVSVFVENRGKETLSDIGFSKKKIKLSIVLDIIFAAGLLAVFLKDGIPKNILDIHNLYAASYIITAGVFEMTFIYGFLRMSFEKAFGAIPSIILTSAFYSFHHAGFQPEF